ncbi:hypothetical protein GGD50_001955 [Rhizobium paranaense]|uniref:Uncharacterized protein n=1 Tax=Rhizobium paranaense TaxID=1650438 RepID=A0A7W8XPR5_9HYPH|nr:hypothetical protein [Rhizobium paranaense]
MRRWKTRHDDLILKAEVDGLADRSDWIARLW